MNVENHAAVTSKDGDVHLLTFKMDEQEYALEIDNVVQVARMVALTPVPEAPDYVEGMVNLHGKIIPVINLRKRCALAQKPCDLNTQLLIAQVNTRMFGLTVDAVSEVLALAAANIESPERIGAPMQSLLGVGNRGDRMVLILDPESLLGETA